MTTVPSPPSLTQGLGFWEATAINITQIVGAGVFATVPLILGYLPGWHALLAWLVAGILILADGMVWGELGAALPASGGSYHFLLESFGKNKWGRLMAFLFVWQILISGPLEVGSGLVAAAQFSTAISPEYHAFDKLHTHTFSYAFEEGKTIGFTLSPSRFIGFSLGVLILFLLYRKVTDLGKMSLVFLVGVLGALFWILFEGLPRLDLEVLFAPVQPKEMPKNMGTALGAGMGLAIYSYFGYYNVCYLGSEVKLPGRTIPLSILTSVIAVVILFCLVHVAFVSVIPWREAMTFKDNLAAEFMSRLHGPWAATGITVLLMGSCFASSFSGMLGYSRVPYAAAKNGHFFPWFGAVHETHKIPHRSLLLIGGMVLFWSFFNLDTIITALIATRILEQFVAQAVGVMVLRRSRPELVRPWKMWFYPLPSFVALVGWLYLYFATGDFFMVLGAATLLVGAIVFLIWSKLSQTWPFAKGV